MKLKTIILAAIICATSLTSRAQYYEMANQLTNLISPALSGSLKYRGFVEAKGVAGLGPDRANFIGISTTQGFQYASWFFMGAGMGIDMVKTRDTIHAVTGPDNAQQTQATDGQTRAMIPVFSDFRFNIGLGSQASLFIDMKLGAAWLLGSSYLQLNRSALTTAAQFYMVPSAGVRIPVSATRAKQAINIGIAYQLLTSNNRYYNYNTPTLSSLGMTIGFEW